MSDYIATEVRPIKNAYGLPTGDGGFTTEPLESDTEENLPLEGMEPDVEEEVVGVREEATDSFEAGEAEGEEDILGYLADEPDESVSEESELDRLRRERDILAGRLEERAALMDRELKQEAADSQEDEEIDLDNPQFQKAVREKLEEDPSLVFPLMKEIMDRKFKSYDKKFESQQARQSEEAVSIEQQNRLKESFAKGLQSAQELGPVEKRIVEQVAEAVATRQPNDSVLLRYLEKNPHLANSPEGIEGAVVTLAKKAELRARNKGVDITSGSKPTASNRSRRMMEKQTQSSDEGDYAEETFKRLMATRKGNLDALLRGK